MTSTPRVGHAAARLLSLAAPRARPSSACGSQPHHGRGPAPPAPSSLLSPLPRPCPHPYSTEAGSCGSGNAPQHFSTVNQSEISHFDALASTWWDKQGPSRLLHLMNPLRHDFIHDCHASEPPPPPPPPPAARAGGLRYLDVGCGGGIFAESAARLPSVASVTALDASAEVIAVARKHLTRETPAVQRKLTYLHSPVEALDVGGGGGGDQSASAASDGRFDVVTTFEVVEHVENPSAFLERCGALVRPGGWLVLSTMARTWASWAVTIVAAERVLGIVPRGTHNWDKYLDAHELRRWFDSRPAAEGWAGLGSFSRCQGVVYVPGLGWKAVPGSEKVGNYFFGARKSPDAS
ncbi:hexaprenyldihydroxybenzoate methyltransferase [Gaeumannomyces tritici R3-111a-1]|uniref:Ubiquinone biosynthesis O-methyltransferase, mitochondrial n=1 Tax=Gaeumannomyces tritici (strain R3-111a-1) TaxID=644352 RepID=J3NHW5_GAET3|nr:hexaprenyldihydroxybenzoate methyltransferase [Gaeumannomyces tritici R3-111a-1]EJT80858.1 hexaprenyldihydroxybenzoate methyltransferase [Gaeumannomyces tritici R3-111a-1]